MMTTACSPEGMISTCRTVTVSGVWVEVKAAQPVTPRAPCSVLEQLVGIGVPDIEHGFDAVPELSAHRLDLHQLIHKYPIAQMDGTRPAEVWGLFQQSQVKQGRHVVSDRSGGVGTVQIQCNHLGTDRLTGLGVKIRNDRKHPAFSFVQFHCYRLLLVLALIYLECQHL